MGPEVVLAYQRTVFPYLFLRGVSLCRTSSRSSLLRCRATVDAGREVSCWSAVDVRGAFRQCAMISVWPALASRSAMVAASSSALT